MKIGMVGLGRMGAGMSRRLMEGGHIVVAYDRDPAAVKGLADDGAVPASSLGDLAAKLPSPRAVWVMVPAGEATRATVDALAGLLAPGDCVVDGGNSHYKDDVLRAAELKARGLSYVDVGTSGGVWGRERGYCLMVGGEKEAVARLAPVFRTLAPGRGGVAPSAGTPAGSTAPDGWLHCGPAAAEELLRREGRAWRECAG